MASDSTDHEFGNQASDTAAAYREGSVLSKPSVFGKSVILNNGRRICCLAVYYTPYPCISTSNGRLHRGRSTFSVDPEIELP